jgi:uncharacterized protein (AIM24 family)
MSTLVAQTISNGTVSTSSANVIQGSAKAWVNFNGTGTVAIRASYNVSSITDNGTGNYTINFTNAMVDANYAVTVTTSCQTGWIGSTLQNATAPTTSAVRVACFTGAGTFSDEPFINAAIFR